MFVHKGGDDLHLLIVCVLNPGGKLRPGAGELKGEIFPLVLVQIPSGNLRE